MSGTPGLSHDEGANQLVVEPTVPDTLIVASFCRLLQAFAPCFTAPSFRTFLTVMCGWSLTLSRHTVTGVVRAANAVGWKHISSFHRFFAKARWSLDGVSLVLVRLLDDLLPVKRTVVVVIDDTLGRHTGKMIAGASMHRDPLLSTGKRPVFHWGHVWVVAGLCLELFGKTWCLPVLVRLYRSPKLCTASRQPHRKCTELAAELIAMLAKALPHRHLVVVGDSAYTNRSIVKDRPSNVTVVGRSRLDAALFAPPPARRRGQMGRPRVRGARLRSPGEQAACPRARWRSLQVNAYGRTATVRVLVLDALWYSVGRSELMRLVIVRNFPGHERDDVFVSTDPSMSAEAIIETYCRRWSLEVTFHETKGKLGLEQPQNRTELAVHRTAPLALLLYSLVLLWYVQTGQRLRAARTTALPWYRTKTVPAFSDMLATLRRASWAERLFASRANGSTLRKQIGPLLQYLDAAV